MISIIVAGHGHFASGMISALELVAGEQPQILGVDFSEGKTVENLQQEYQVAMNELDLTDGLVFFTDIPGGTPFNEAVKLNINQHNVAVITGTNLPILLAGLFNRKQSLESYVTDVLADGKAAVMQYAKRTTQDTSVEDGI